MVNNETSRIEPKWICAEIDEKIVIQLQNDLNIPYIIAVLLNARDIKNANEAKTFFQLTEDQLHDPFMMLGMQKAVNRCKTALNNSEKILIYGDYDVDGVCSVVMLYDFFDSIGGNVSYYIPNRIKEGYGLHMYGTEYIIKNDIDLVITVDCGTNSVSSAKKLKEHGIDLIITDHHTIGNTIPKCISMLNPNQENCSYPFKSLSGAGICYKMLQAISKENNYPESKYKVYLDLVALSIAADIVPMKNENRVLMKLGLNQLMHTKRIGMESIISTLKQKKDRIDTAKIVFQIAPLINSAGRMKHANIAVKALTENTVEDANTYIEQMQNLNIQRKDIEKEMFIEACQMIEKEYKNDSVFVLYHKNWHTGIAGIVASKITEHYNKPTILLTDTEKTVKGSARAHSPISILELLSYAKPYLISYGGHQYAAGLELLKNKILTIRGIINKEYKKKYAHIDTSPIINIDAKLTLNDMDRRLWKIILHRMSPYGPYNRRPIFMTENITLTKKPTILKEKHLMLHLKQYDSGIYKAMGFNMGYKLSQLSYPTHAPINIVYSFYENDWNNKIHPVIHLRDIKINP